MFSSVRDNLLFTDYVALNVRFDINVNHMFERNYIHKLAWHKASRNSLTNKIVILSLNSQTYNTTNRLC